MYPTKKVLNPIDLNLHLQNYTEALHLWLSPKNTTGWGVLVRKQDSLGSPRSYTSSALFSHKALSQALISDRFHAFDSISPRKLWCGLGFLFVCSVCWLWFLLLLLVWCFGVFLTKLSFCEAFKFSMISLSFSAGN